MLRDAGPRRRGSVFIIYTLVLISHGLLNTFGVGLVKRLMDISVWWHVFGVLVIVIALIVIPDRGNTIGFGASFDYKNFTGWSFGGSGIYVFIIGMLIAQYTITGFDASAHVSEETKDAKVGAPKAIVRSIYISVIAGVDPELHARGGDPEGRLQEPVRRRPEGPRRRRNLADPGAAADLRAVGRGEHVQDDHLHRDRRAVLLWHGVGHRELADDLRVQP